MNFVLFIYLFLLKTVDNYNIKKFMKNCDIFLLEKFNYAAFVLFYEKYWC